jgi:hypothetical protein
MKYKLFKYEFRTASRRPVLQSEHLKLFEAAKGLNETGQYVEYRGKKDTLLMHFRNYENKFIGLIGRLSRERDVTLYNNTDDSIYVERMDDEDHPNTPFICFPRIGMIVCVDGAAIPAHSAMSRLHQIFAAKSRIIFEVEEISQSFDLRKATKEFRITQVDFEVIPVNPHTDDLGRQLDESRKLDHIKKIRGTAEASKSAPMQLRGGFLTALQQLQQSGHCKVGFHGVTEDGVEVQVPKPSRPRRLSDDEDVAVAGEEVGVRIKFPGPREHYPFSKAHVLEVLKVAKKFLELESDEK